MLIFMQILDAAAIGRRRHLPHNSNSSEANRLPASSSCSRPLSFAAKDAPQLVLRPFEHGAASPAERLARPIDVVDEHRHRRAERIGLATPAALGRPLERARDRSWIVAREHPRREVQRVAGRCHALRPALRGSRPRAGRRTRVRPAHRVVSACLRVRAARLGDLRHCLACHLCALAVRNVRQ
jgi:hypothetical protein